MERIDWLNQWLGDLAGKHPVDWDLLPDIGLYMDQVQTFIERQLRLYQNDARERLLTPAMINNYIKDDLIPRAAAKKYTPSHLALLIMIGTLKQVLSIQNLNELLSDCRQPEEIAAIYRHFLTVQQEALQENAAQVLDETSNLRLSQQTTDQSDVATEAIKDQKDQADAANTDVDLTRHKVEQTEALRSLALELAIEARVRILIAEKILSLLDQADIAEPPEKTDRKKRGS